MSEKFTNLSEYIAENFGANASYVEGLLNRYKSDPNLVDESWRTFFTDLMNGNAPTDGGIGQSATTTGEKVKSDLSKKDGAATTTTTVPTATQPAKTPPTVSIGADTEVKAITGASKKIVENMEQSLTVPTATSLRRVPVKVLEENRRIVNEQMQTSGRSKVSFTHLIAWAIVKS
ncbi:MAG: 2-oxo acid dehydrogenase subunit E2, partial [Acidobacteriota bacterium]|nr:2-oxo acid dehydrogenase subunit E2 [Acidobacteriota bacterium]